MSAPRREFSSTEISNINTKLIAALYPVTEVVTKQQLRSFIQFLEAIPAPNILNFVTSADLNNTMLRRFKNVSHADLEVLIPFLKNSIILIGSDTQLTFFGFSILLLLGFYYRHDKTHEEGGKWVFLSGEELTTLTQGNIEIIPPHSADLSDTLLKNKAVKEILANCEIISTNDFKQTIFNKVIDAFTKINTPIIHAWEKVLEAYDPYFAEAKSDPISIATAKSYINDFPLELAECFKVEDDYIYFQNINNPTKETFFTLLQFLRLAHVIEQAKPSYLGFNNWLNELLNSISSEEPVSAFNSLIRSIQNNNYFQWSIADEANSFLQHAQANRFGIALFNQIFANTALQNLIKNLMQYTPAMAAKIKKYHELNQSSSEELLSTLFNTTRPTHHHSLFLKKHSTHKNDFNKELTFLKENAIHEYTLMVPGAFVPPLKNTDKFGLVFTSPGPKSTFFAGYCRADETTKQELQKRNGLQLIETLSQSLGKMYASKELLFRKMKINYLRNKGLFFDKNRKELLLDFFIYYSKKFKTEALKQDQYLHPCEVMFLQNTIKFDAVAVLKRNLGQPIKPSRNFTFILNLRDEWNNYLKSVLPHEEEIVNYYFEKLTDLYKTINISEAVNNQWSFIYGQSLWELLTSQIKASQAKHLEQLMSSTLPDEYKLLISANSPRYANLPAELVFNNTVIFNNRAFQKQTLKYPAITSNSINYEAELILQVLAQRQGNIAGIYLNLKKSDGSTDTEAYLAACKLSLYFLTAFNIRLPWIKLDGNKIGLWTEAEINNIKKNVLVDIIIIGKNKQDITPSTPISEIDFIENMLDFHLPSTAVANNESKDHVNIMSSRSLLHDTNSGRISPLSSNSNSLFSATNNNQTQPNLSHALNLLWNSASQSQIRSQTNSTTLSPSSPSGGKRSINSTNNSPSKRLK